MAGAEICLGQGGLRVGVQMAVGCDHLPVQTAPCDGVSSPGSSVLSLIHVFMSIWKWERVSTMFVCVCVCVGGGGCPAFNM